MHDDVLKVAALPARPYLPHDHGREFSRSLLRLCHFARSRYHSQRDTVQPLGVTLVPGAAVHRLVGIVRLVHGLLISLWLVLFENRRRDPRVGKLECLMLNQRGPMSRGTAAVAGHSTTTSKASGLPLR